MGSRTSTKIMIAIVAIAGVITLTLLTKPRKQMGVGYIPICRKTGTQLSASELKKKAFLSYANAKLRTIAQYRKSSHEFSDMEFGIIEKNISQGALLRAMDEAEVENFNKINQWSEKSVLTTDFSAIESAYTRTGGQVTAIFHDSGNNGSIHFMPTATLQQIEQTPRLTEQLTFWKRRWPQRYVFFRVDDYTIVKFCCNTSYYRPEKGGLEEAISVSTRFIHEGSDDRALIFAADGCGKAITNKKLNGADVLQHFYNR